MGTDLNFRSSNLQPGMPLGNLPLNITLAADNTVVNPGYTPFIRLTSDNATATSRTFSLTAGSWQGQELFITLVGSSSNKAELLSTGNVNLKGGTWTASVNDTIHLMWDSAASTPVWREVSRSNGIILAGRYTPTYTVGANVVSASALSAMYTRNNNIVTVFGQTAVVTTAATNTLSVFTATLPIASDLAAIHDLSGSGNRLSATGTVCSPVSIAGIIASDLAEFSFNSAATASGLLTYSFSYEVL